MPNLTGGELFIVGSIVFWILSARFWPALGERLAYFVAGSRRKGKE